MESSPAMKSLTSAALLALTAGLLQGCTPPAPVTSSTTRVYATDLQGKAALCTVSSVTPADGKTETVTMVTGGGGWCGIPVEMTGNQPYSAGLVEHRPERGKVFVHTVGDDTRIDYIPLGAVSADTFSVKLVPGNAIITVSVEAPKTGAAK